MLECLGHNSHNAKVQNCIPGCPTVIVWSADLTVLHGNRTVYSDGDEFQSVDVYNGPQ